MMPPRTGPITEQVSQAQIDALGERMDRGIGEIKEMLLRFEERLRGIETREAVCSPLINSRLNAAWARLDTHDRDLEKLSGALFALSRTANMLETISKWLLGIVTAVVIALVIAFLTGRIDILVR